jgi:carbon monoxide dehydrogenase subunit G
MYACERVGLDFIATAPFRLSNTVELAITPDQAFEVLDDAESWRRLSSVITKVSWTSPQPHGVGSTRTVDMRGGIVGNEEFLAWEPFTRLAFRFNECSTHTVAALVEEYRIDPTSGGCRLTWTLALKAAGPSDRAMAVGKPVMTLFSRRFMANFRSYTEKRFATSE